MRKFILLFSVILFASTACNSINWGVKGNGHVVKETRNNLTGFSKIEVSKGIDVYLTMANKESVVVEADENLHKLITTEVKNGTLIISAKKNIWRAKSRKVHVSIISISDITASGGSDVYSTNTISSKSLDCNFSGGSDLTLTLEAQKVDFNFSGGADLNCTYTGSELRYKASGGSDAKFKTSTLNSSYFHLSGASDIKIKGEAKNLKIIASGASDISALNYKVNKANVKLSGASDAKLFVTDELSITASGASDINCTGNPKILEYNVCKSCSAKIR